MGLEAFSLKDKVALVTGGGTGIGFGISKALAEAGARVLITGRREEVLRKAVEELGGNAGYEVMDVTDKTAIPAFVSRVNTEYGAIDILVNNAGIHLKKMALETSDDEFESIMQTNLLSVFSLSRECGRYMTERKSGSIVFIGSMAGIFGIDRVSAYGTSKAALTGLMNNLVTEFSKHNVRINTIAPGWIESPMFLNAVNADPARKEKIENRIAMSCFGNPGDIGNAVVFLSSEAGRYITGVVLPVDGGATVNF
ncbi:SDR family NAD(P)-dependent oxidoreductase [Pararcticibacter amylolyticus]|uniref:3-oxoacyl-ACP reductase n=1 Tax=Pararcticibacter amylolyticus TaxID=2173175 RepID=A0A2U2PD59_9SPHI|nr:glucose 1-dehydrogenase [Pararcticibacter amylolyticus]PWG79327.1 3-oxoacyl-ACP reductase [Pararcticibacter amylolyticus]